MPSSGPVWVTGSVARLRASPLGGFCMSTLGAILGFFGVLAILPSIGWLVFMLVKKRNARVPVFILGGAVLLVVIGVVITPSSGKPEAQSLTNQVQTGLPAPVAKPTATPRPTPTLKPAPTLKPTRKLYDPNRHGRMVIGGLVGLSGVTLDHTLTYEEAYGSAIAVMGGGSDTGPSDTPMVDDLMLKPEVFKAPGPIYWFRGQIKSAHIYRRDLKFLRTPEERKKHTFPGRCTIGDGSITVSCMVEEPALVGLYTMEICLSYANPNSWPHTGRCLKPVTIEMVNYEGPEFRQGDLVDFFGNLSKLLLAGDNPGGKPEFNALLNVYFIVKLAP